MSSKPRITPLTLLAIIIVAPFLWLLLWFLLFALFAWILRLLYMLGLDTPNDVEALSVAGALGVLITFVLSGLLVRTAIRRRWPAPQSPDAPPSGMPQMSTTPSPHESAPTDSPAHLASSSGPTDTFVPAARVPESPIGFTITQTAATVALTKATRLDSVESIIPIFVHRILCAIRCSGTWSCQEQLIDKAAYQQAYQQYQFTLQQWKSNVASYNSQIARNSGKGGNFFASRMLAGSQPSPPSKNDFQKQKARSGCYEVAIEHRDILSGVDGSVPITPTSDAIASCLRTPQVYKCLEAYAKHLTGSNIAMEDAIAHGLWYPDPDDPESESHVAARCNDRLDTLAKAHVLKQAPKHRSDLTWVPPRPNASDIATHVEERACPLWIVRFRRGRKVRHAIVSGTTGVVRICN